MAALTRSVRLSGGRSRKALRSRDAALRAPGGARLGFEHLEERTLLSVGAGSEGLNALIATPSTYEPATSVVDHFDFSTVSNHGVGSAFSVTVTARDSADAIVTSYNGTANLSGVVGNCNGTNPVEILSFVKYASTSSGSNYKNAMTAISLFVTNYHETMTLDTDPASLAADLVGKNVFFVPAQQSAPGGALGPLGTAWTNVLKDFVNAGGVVIVSPHWMGEERLILQNSGLMSLSSQDLYGGTTLTKTSDTVLNSGVVAPFDDGWLEAYSLATNGKVSIQTADEGYPVVLSRDVGLGHVVMIGTPFSTADTQMDKVIGNAVKWGQGGTTSVPMTPSLTGSFVNGVWTGSVTVTQASSGMRFHVDGAGHSGDSNPFDTVATTLDHFDISTVPNQIVDTPFPVTITARNSANGVVASYNGTANVSGAVSTGPSKVEILSFTKYASNSSGSNYRNAMTAISFYVPNYHETMTADTDPAALAADLVGKNVFFVPAQQSAPGGALGPLGTAWTNVLKNFVDGGGVVIVSPHWMGEERLILQNSGLMSLSTQQLYGGASLTKSSDTALNAGVYAPFDDSWMESYSIATNGTASIQTTNEGYPVVLSRDVGLGHVVMIGTAFSSVGTQMAKVIGNAVKWTQGTVTPVPTLPMVTGNFVNGVWTGSVMVDQTATGMHLHADDVSGHSSNGNTFNVGPMTVLQPPILAAEPAVTPGTQNTIGWPSVPGADHYYAQYDTDPSFASPDGNSGWITGTQYTFTGLASNQKYYYEVKARRQSPGDAVTWTQTTQSDFLPDTLTNATATGNGTVVLGPGAGSEVTGRIANASFESGARNTTPSGWTHSNGGVGTLNECVQDAVQFGMPSIGGKYEELYTYSDDTFSVGDYVQASQAVDLTGLATLQFDASLNAPAGWLNKIKGMLLIDGVEKWTRSASGLYANQSIDVSSYTGIHTIALRNEVVTAGTYASQWVTFDNLRTFAPSYVSSGSLVSSAITRGVADTWGALAFAKSAPIGTALTVDVLPATGSTPIPGYTNVSSGTSLAGIAGTTIRLRANLSTNDSAVTPALNDWSVTSQQPISYLTSPWSNVESSTQDATAPMAAAFLPAANATGVALDANLAITFSEAMQKGTSGNIVIKRSSNNDVVETIPVTSSQVTIVGNQATIDPSVTFSEKTGYYVQISGTAITDLVNNAYAGIGDAATWNFTTGDFTPPTVVGITPGIAGGILLVGITSLQVQFDENVVGTAIPPSSDYLLQSLGPDALLGTTDDTFVAVSATYAGSTATLTFAALPESVYRLTIKDTVTDLAGNKLDGDSNGAASGNWFHDFIANQIPGPFNLLSSHSLSFYVDAGDWGAGQLASTDGVAAGLNRLQVGGADYAPNTSYAMDDSGCTVLTGLAGLGGLNVHREITVANTGNEDFSRTVDVFENPTANPITATVRIVGNLGSDGATTVFNTSDGDTTLETTDQWIGTDDADGTGTPAVIHYIHGPNGLKPTSATRTGDNIEWTYSLTVPAGMTLRLAHFTILADHRADAVAAANALVATGGFGGQAAAFLSPAERGAIVNFFYNDPPALINVPASATIPEMAAYTFDADATDLNLPPQSMTFSLANFDASHTVPTGATINSSTGVFTWTPSETQGPGSYKFKVQVSDGMATTEQTVELTVGEVNVAPVLSNVPASATISELSAYTFDANATDADVPTQSVTFSLADFDATHTVPSWATINASTGVFTWTPSEVQGPGIYTFKVRASDGVTPSEQTVTLTVNEMNVAPALTNVPTAATIAEAQAYTFDANATDSDLPAQNLTFRLADFDATYAVPVGAMIDESTGVFAWTPSEAQGPGVYKFKVQVNDGMATTEKAVTLTVNEVNVAPVLSNLPDSATIPELSAYTFDANATDVDLPAQGLAFSLADFDATHAVPLGATIDPSTGVFTWTPTEAQGPGVYQFKVQASDGVVTSGHTVTLTVSEGNVLPILRNVPATATISELSTYTFQATVTDADLPSQILTFSLADFDASHTVPAGATIGASTGVFSWTPSEAQGPGVYKFKVQVSDGVATAEQTVEMTITDVNASPLLSNVPNSATIPELSAYAFDANATDTDLPAQNLTFSLADFDGTHTAPSGAAIDPSTGMFTWTPTENQGPGVYLFKVQVSDGVATTEQTLTLTVSESNTSPVLNGVPASATIPELSAYAFDANATDTDLPSQNLTFSLADFDGTHKVPLGASINVSTGMFAWTPSETQGPGVYKFKVQVSDALATVEQTVELSVSDVNAAPVLAAIGNRNVDEQATLAFTALAIEQDFPVQTVVYGLDQASQEMGMRIDPVTGAFRWTPSHAQLGRYQTTITATDNGINPASLTASETVTITVGGVANLPAKTGGYSLLVHRNGANVELINPKDTKHPYWTAPAEKTFALTIRGLENAADTLTADYAGGPLGNLEEVVFDAKGGKSADALVIKNSLKNPPATDDTVEIAADRVVYNGTSFVTAGVETLSVDTGKGNDVISIFGLGAKVTLIDAAGADALDFSHATSGLNLSLATTAAQKIFAGNANTLTLKGTFENAAGTELVDVIRGNSLANWIEGNGGNDTLYGGSGDDRLYGDSGDDWLYGEAGNDSLYGGSGNNVLVGSDGNDLLDVAIGASTASGNKNLLIGGKGVDTLQGGDGEEILIGGTTSYDSKASALSAIMRQWTSNEEFTVRSKRLTDGIVDPANPKGLIQLVRKDKTHAKGTVLDDMAADSLFGGSGSDWFFDFAKDNAGDRDSTDL